MPLADLVVGVENGMDATRKNLRVRSSQAPASGAVDLLLDISSSAGQRQVQVSILVPLRGAGADATPASVGGKARAGASAGGATLNVKPGDTLYAIAQLARCRALPSTRCWWPCGAPILRPSYRAT